MSAGDVERACIESRICRPHAAPRAALRARFGPALRVLYVSGYVAQDESLDLSATGTGYLVKPYAPAELVEQVHRLLEDVPVDPGAPAAAVVE